MMYIIFFLGGGGGGGGEKSIMEVVDNIIATSCSTINGALFGQNCS